MTTSNASEHVKKYQDDLGEYEAERKTVNGEYIHVGFNRRGTQLYLALYTTNTRNNPMEFRINESSPNGGNIITSIATVVTEAVVELKGMRNSLERAKRGIRP